MYLRNLEISLICDSDKHRIQENPSHQVNHGSDNPQSVSFRVIRLIRDSDKLCLCQVSFFTDRSLSEAGQWDTPISGKGKNSFASAKSLNLKNLRFRQSTQSYHPQILKILGQANPLPITNIYHPHNQ